MAEIYQERRSGKSSITSHTAASLHSKVQVHTVSTGKRKVCDCACVSASLCLDHGQVLSLSPPLSGQNTSSGIWRRWSLATRTCGPGAATFPEPAVTFDHCGRYILI